MGGYFNEESCLVVEFEGLDGNVSVDLLLVSEDDFYL